MTTLKHLYDTFHPEHYDLSIEIDRLGRAFSGTVTIKGDVMPNQTSIGLHAKDLTIDSVTFDGKAADHTAGDNDELWVSHADIAPGDHVIVIGFNGQITDAMHGMYPCKFTVDGQAKELIATQFESHHAREVFPCIDEPEAKATFDLVLTTEPDVAVLSNLHHVNQTKQGDKLVTTFATTPRMSTYLLAWVVGDLHKKSAETISGVEVNVWATPAQRPESLDFALENAVKIIEFFDDYFGVPYPLPKSDHVALPDFSSGAMENWGLITYREVALLADPATTTVASKQYIATVIAHELSHQWFGNLVTMKWWNNLWLNESFATLMEYLAVDAIHPEWNAWLDFASHESVLALRRDAIEGVQSVQVDVNHPDEISSLFDGAIVYAKGARLLRMCQAYVGNEAFQRGLQSYFEEFAYLNTEADDLWRHLSDASGKDISGLMNTWISQSGYPVVSVDDKGLKQEQFFIGPHNKSSKLWPIPLGAESTEDMPELLEVSQLPMPIAKDERLNVGDTAHFITQYAPDRLAAIIDRDDLTELDRLQLIHERLLLVRGGRADSDSLIALSQHFADDNSEHVWDMIAHSLGELKKFVEDDELAEQGLRKLYGKLANEQYQRLGWMPTVGESENDTKLRSTIIGMMIYSRQPSVLQQVDALYSSGIESLDPELRPLVIASVVHRTDDAKLIQDLFATYRESSSADLQNDIAAGLTNAKQPEHIAYLLQSMLDTSIIRSQDTARWFVYLIRNRYSRSAAWQWMKSNWDWVEKTFGGDKSFDQFPRYAATGLSSREQRDDYQAFFEPHRADASLTRTIDLGILEIDARIELLERDGEAVRRALSQQQ